MSFKDDSIVYFIECALTVYFSLLDIEEQLFISKPFTKIC